MSNYLMDDDADLQAVTEAFARQVEDEEINNLNRTGATSVFRMAEIRWAQARITSTGMVARFVEWRAEDEELAKRLGETKHAGGAPIRTALSDEHILIALLLLAKEHTSLHTLRIRDFFWFRLSDEARVHLGINWGPETGEKHAIASRWHSRANRALFRIINLMDGYPAERIVMNRAERDHQMSLREKNRVRLNLDAKKMRVNEFSFALIEMSIQMMGPELLSRWKGSVSIDQTTVKSIGKRGLARNESRDPTIDSTVLEPDAGWAIKNPDKRGNASAAHAGEATFGFKATFATMVGEDPKSPRSPHPRIIAAMTLGTPGVGTAAAAIELLRQLKDAKYPAGRVTTDKEYAANFVPADYAFPLLALGYSILTDYRKDRLGVRGNQRGALILDGKHKCPALPEHLRTYNKDFVLNGIAIEDANSAAGFEKDWTKENVRLAAHDVLYEESAKYNFKQHEGPDAHGAVKLSCPARGKYATVVCPLVEQIGLTKNRDRAVVIDPPTNPPECCTQEVLTMPVTKEWRDIQTLEYQSPAWRDTYAVDRNLGELVNGRIKDGSKEALDDSARRMLRGLTAQQVLVTFLVVITNMRNVFSYRDEQAIPEEKQKDRKSRARYSLSIRNYDPRIAEVREAQGMPPLLNSRRKDAKEMVRRLELD